jgi:hypothetical protein
MESAQSLAVEVNFQRSVMSWCNPSTVAIPAQLSRKISCATNMSAQLTANCQTGLMMAAAVNHVVAE